MGNWTETKLPDGRIEGRGTVVTNGVVANVRYTRPGYTGKELEKAAQPFWNTFYQLVREGKTTLTKK